MERVFQVYIVIASFSIIGFILVVAYFLLKMKRNASKQQRPDSY